MTKLMPTNRGSADTVSKQDRKSTRLNSSHVSISYAVFCLKKKKGRQPFAREDRERLGGGRRHWRILRAPVRPPASPAAVRGRARAPQSVRARALRLEREPL